MENLKLMTLEELLKKKRESELKLSSLHNKQMAIKIL